MRRNINSKAGVEAAVAPVVDIVPFRDEGNFILDVVADGNGSEKCVGIEIRNVYGGVYQQPRQPQFLAGHEKKTALALVEAAVGLIVFIALAVKADGQRGE